MSKLAITNGKGFQITFANGCTASVQWGPGNYCDRRSTAWREGPEYKTFGRWESSDAEVAAWVDFDSKWITKEIIPGLGDDVAGHLDADQVLDFLNKVAAYKGVTMSVLTEQDKEEANSLLPHWNFLLNCYLAGHEDYGSPARDLARRELHDHGMLTPQEYIVGEAIEQGVI